VVVSYESNGAIATVFTEQVIKAVALSMSDWAVHDTLEFRWFY